MRVDKYRQLQTYWNNFRD